MERGLRTRTSSHVEQHAHRARFERKSAIRHEAERLGELVYRLKNRSDRKALVPIAEAAAEFIKGWAPKVDTIVPVPPSRRRAYQPVVEIAKAIGRLLSVPVDLAAIVKAKDTPKLKNVFDFKERTTALQGAFKFNEKAIRGERILLADDLYRSGATASIGRHSPDRGWGDHGVHAGDDQDSDAHMTKAFIAGSRKLSRLPPRSRPASTR